MWVLVVVVAVVVVLDKVAAAAAGLSDGLFCAEGDHLTLCCFHCCQSNGSAGSCSSDSPVTSTWRHTVDAVQLARTNVMHKLSGQRQLYNLSHM